MVSPDEVRALFEKRLSEGIPVPPGKFHPQDLERLKDDKYLTRVLEHCRGDQVKASKMLWNILKWRQTVEASDLNEGKMRMDYINEGGIFPHGRDLDGARIIVVKCKSHVKGQKDFEEVKKIIIYWLDRVEREEGGQRVTLFFDLDGCGLSNLDVDLIRYMITLFSAYYPMFLKHIIVYQLPWMLTAAFKMVKRLLPPEAVEIMKFVNKDTLKEIVSPEQALTCWGGKDDYVFEFTPEKKPNNKKVTFQAADIERQVSRDLQRIV